MEEAGEPTKSISRTTMQKELVSILINFHYYFDIMKKNHIEYRSVFFTIIILAMRRRMIKCDYQNVLTYSRFVLSRINIKYN